MSTTPADLNAPLARLLGAPCIECGDRAYELLPERRHQLLAYLAHRADWVTRDTLAFMLWPDHENAEARRNLRWVVHSCRALPEFAGMEVERERVRFSPVTDVRQFESAIQAKDWACAAALYRGPFCRGLDAHASESFAKWLLLERGRLAGLFRGGVMELAAASGAEEAVELAARLLDEDPFDEAALRVRLRALGELAHHDLAAREYRAFAERMLDELGLEPGAETRSLALSRTPAATSSVRNEEAVTSFVGRTRELAHIDALLSDPECRLLTLLGPGGVGKSRLATEAMTRQSLGRKWAVALERLTVPGQVAAQVARSIGVVLSANDDAAALVATHVGQTRALLLLDNFEHVIDAGEQLSRWLSACSQLRIVVTSRERLDVAGEWLLPVEGLGFPRKGTAGGGQFDAVMLFVARARAAKRDFDAIGERKGIVDIVAKVEGLPLAIELAAAWTRLLPCEEIAKDLAQNLELLESQAAARREHRSVRASFEHSWALLVPRERALFASLAVFRGGFGRNAVREVADGALSAVTQLVDKSLVQVDAAGRFKLHPLLHQFAAEKLASSAQAEATVRRRHAEFFTHWITRKPQSAKMDEKSFFAELDAELDNCLAAWQWAIDHQRADLVETCVRPLVDYFELRSMLTEGLACFDAADELDPASAGYGPVGHVQRARATILLRLGRYEMAEERARRALQCFRLARDRTGIKGALATLGLAYWERGRYAEARPYFQEGLKRSREDVDRRGVGTFLTNLALLAKAEGRHAEVEAMLSEALAVFREVENIHGQLNALNNLGNLYRAMRQYARARAPLLEALAIAEDADHRIVMPFLLVNLALIEVDLGAIDAARNYAQRALALVRDGAEMQIEIGCLATLARIAVAAGSATEARAHARAAARVARRSNHMPGMLGIAVSIAGALRLEGHPQSAAAILFMVRDHAAAGQLDRDDADRALAELESAVPRDALDEARERGRRIALEDVIADAMGPAPVS